MKRVAGLALLLLSAAIVLAGDSRSDGAAIPQEPDTR